MIRLYCPREHFIADVDITEDGRVIPRGIRHGLSFDYVPSRDISCVRARCLARRCPYDASMDYLALCVELAAVAARGDTKHILTH